MKLSSALLFAGSVWECVRFGLAAMVLFGPGAPLPGGNASIIWFASPQLVIAGMLFMLAVFPDRYLRLFGIVILAKLLAVSSGAAAAVPAILTQGGMLEFTQSAVVVIAIVAGDLILLAGLLVIRRDPPSERTVGEPAGESEHGSEENAERADSADREAAESPRQSGAL